jgi:hypothetical protein
MAATVALDGINITTAETTTGWSTVTISGPTQENNTYLQNNYAVSAKASNKSGELYFDYGSGLNFTTTYSGACIFMWMQCTTLGLLETLTNNGLAIRIYSTTSNYNEYRIAGSNDLTGYESTPGFNGFKNFVIDPTRPPTTQGGTGLDLTSVRYYGVHIETTGLAKTENLIIDRIDVGWGLRVYGTSTDGWQDIADADMGTVANRYGIFQEVAKNSYHLFGGIQIGDDQGTTGTTFTSQDGILQFISQQYYDGSSWVPFVNHEFFKLSVVGNGTNATTWTDGIIVGSGDTASGRNGSVIVGSDLHDTEVDLYDGSNAANDVNLYGTVFKEIRKSFTWGNDSDHVFYGGTVDKCNTFDPVGAPKIRNVVFSNTKAWWSTAVEAAIAEDGGVFTDETAEANSATAADVTLTPTVPVASDRYYIGHIHQFSAVEFDISTAGSGAPITYQYSQGSDTWASLTVVDETQSFGYTGKSRVTFTPPGDWATDTKDGQGPFYYVRAVVGTVSSPTGAVADQIWVYGPADGAALKWNSSIDIKNCSFLGNTDSDNDPAGVEHPDPGSFSYYGMVCSGNDNDILNSSGTNITINADADSVVGSTNEDAWYRSTLMKAQQYNATGTVYIDESTAAQDYNDGDMNFLNGSDETGDAYLFGHTTAQFTALDVYIAVSGTGTRTVTWYYSTGAGTWSALSGVTDGTTGFTATQGWKSVTFTAPGAGWVKATYNSIEAYWIKAEITSYTSTGTLGTGTQCALIGDTDPVATKTLTITCKDEGGTGIEGVRVRIEDDPLGTLVSEGTTNASGVYTDSSYNYTGDEDVKVVARLKGYENVAAFDTITTSGLSVPFTMPTDESVDLP